MLKKPGLLFLSLMAMLFVVVASSAPAHAATLEEDSEKFITYRAIHACLVKNDLGNKSPSDVIDGNWWSLPASQDWMGVALLSGDDKNETSCQNEKGDNFIASSANTLGFSDAGAMWCSIQPNAYRDNEGSGANDFEKCTSGSGEFDASGSESQQGAQFTNGIKSYSSLKTGFPFEPTGAMRYHIYLETFKAFCDVERVKDYISSTDKTRADSNEYVVVNEVILENGEPNIVPALYKVNVDDGQKHTVFGVWSQPDGDSYNLNCGELAGKTWDFDEAYGLYIKANPDDASTPGNSDPGSIEPVCSAGALGWVICPLAEGLVEAIQGIAEMLEGLLKYQPLIGSSQGNAIKAIWNLILVIANLGLVIAILIIVFSQATSVGLSNYGIKKLLPRVFAAAILMNLSFYLCAVAVDLSNILGISIKSIVESGMSQLQTVNQGNDAVDYGAGFAQHFTVGVGGLLIAAIAFSTGAIWLLLPILVSGLVAIITALLILAARQVLITLLIIIAPLAFLAWILPNTDEWFTKWRKLFTILLLLFPMIMAIFYGSILVSAVILSAGANSTNGLNDFTIKLLAFLVLIVPLFSLPFIMKAAGGILDRFGVLVNNRNKGIVDRSRKVAQRGQKTTAARFAGNEWGKDQANRRGAFKRGLSKGAKFTGGYSARRDFRQTSLQSDADRIQQNEIAGKLQSEDSSLAARSTMRGSTGQAIARARGVQIQDKAIGEEMSAAKTVIDNMEFSNAELSKLSATGTAVNMKGQSLSGDFYQKAAQQQLISTGQVGHVYKMLENAPNMSQEVRESLSYNLSQNYSMLKAKDHTLNDDVIKNALITGGGSISQQQLDTAALGKMSGLTKQVFAGQDAAGISHLERGILSAQQQIQTLSSSQNPADVKTVEKLKTQVNDAYATARSAYEDPQLAKDFTVASRAATEKLLGIPPTPPTPTGTP